MSFSPTKRVVAALGATLMLAPSVMMLGSQAAQAATGELYLLQATDPHGNVWLPGTVDGTTTGALDPGTDPSSASFGHLWTTDVPSGFCRITPASTDPNTGVTTPASLDRTTAGGCITTGGKAGQPELDKRRNADGTFYVYTPDWAVRSSGVYRMTYDPGRQVMTKSELLAPNRYPFDNKPFDVQLGPGDQNLYVSNDKDGNIARITNVNGAIASQAVSVSVAKTADGSRSRAITFACWSNLNVLGVAARAPGAPGCTPADPAPDLVIAQKTAITVVLNAETCQAAAGGCVTRSTPIKVLTPMGLRTDPSDPSVIYVSDSPGAVSQVIRYRIGPNIQDSYANYGILDDGSVTNLSFAFSVGFGPDHAMYIGDDPTAGATAFNGRYFRLAPNAPADAIGRPGVPATPPPPPSAATGTLFAGPTLAINPPPGYASPNLPGDPVFLGTHLWLPDSVNGLCRLDNPVIGAGPSPTAFLNLATCQIGATAGGLTKPEQSAYDANTNFLYVADGGTKSVGVVRFTFNPATETLSSPSVIASAFANTGQGLDNQRADAVALDPVTDDLYVGFRARNLGANTQIARVHHASVADTSTQNVEFIAKTTRSVPVFGLGVVVNPAVGAQPATSDLYIGDNKGVDLLTNVSSCAAGGCTAILALNVRGPRGFATDGVDHLYLAGPPAPGTGNSTTPVQQYTISTGQLFTYSSVGVNPVDNTQGQYQFVFGLGLGPDGSLYVADSPDAVPPIRPGHVYRVGSLAAGPPAPPSITSFPANPTNLTTPRFSFSTLSLGATFECSLVAAGAADAFSACTSNQQFGPLTPDGSFTFKVRARNAAGVSAPAIYSFAVDTVSPLVTINSAPASPTQNNTPTFTFSVNESSTLECSLTTGAPAFTPCGSPQTYPVTPDGAYTFSVRATDLAGNVSAVQSAPLTIDTVVPTVTATPAGGNFTGPQLVALSSSKNGPIFYTTDGSTPTAAATLYTAPISIDTSTVLKFIGTDGVGHTSPVKTETYTIGAVVISSSPANPSADSTPKFSFSAPSFPDATFQCALTATAPTAADFAPCTSPVSYPATADGTWTFTVQGTDPVAGNVGSATYQYLLAAAAPGITLNPANPSNSSTETFAFTKNPAAGFTFECSMVPTGNADNHLPCASPVSYPNTADGSWTFKVRAVDAVGVRTKTTDYVFSVAASVPPTTTAPTVSLPQGSGPASTTAAAANLSWTGSANSVGYEVQQSVNGGPFIDLPGCTVATPCVAPTAVTTMRPSPTNQPANVTTYKYQVRAINSSGVWGAYATMANTVQLPATDNTAGFSFNGGWSGVNLAGSYNGSEQQATVANAFAQNATPLVGTSLGLLASRGPDHGKADITVDGALVATIDLYSATAQPARLVWVSTPVANVGHTIRVTVRSDRNAASTSTKVGVDAYLALR